MAKKTKVVGKQGAAKQSKDKLSGTPGRFARLAAAIAEVRAGQRISPRTAKLLSAGVPKIAQKFVEEAANTAIDAVRGDQVAVLNQSVDALYNLAVLWSEMGIEPAQIWAEMDKREAALGMVEKQAKPREEDT